MLTDRRGRGQSLVEFALVLPFFAILLFGIIDLGRYVYTANTLGNAVREGARSGSVSSRPSPTCDGLGRQACVVAIVDEKALGVTSAVTTTVTCHAIAPNDPTPNAIAMTDCTTNDLLTVQAQTTFNLVTPIVAQFIGSLGIAADTSVEVHN